MKLGHTHQRILSIPGVPESAIFNLPLDINKAWLIGDVEPALSRHVRRLRTEGLIRRVGFTKKQKDQYPRLLVWKTTDKYVEYYNKYHKEVNRSIKMASLGALSIHHIRQRLLSTGHPEDIFLLPKPGVEFFIGDKAPNLSKFTKKLEQGELIKKIRKGRRMKHNSSATVWVTTGRFVEYCEKYKEVKK